MLRLEKFLELFTGIFTGKFPVKVAVDVITKNAAVLILMVSGIYLYCKIYGSKYSINDSENDSLSDSQNAVELYKNLRSGSRRLN